MGIRLTLNELKSIIGKMEEEKVKAIYMDLSCMDSSGNDTIEFDIWKYGKYIKTIFTKKY